MLEKMYTFALMKFGGGGGRLAKLSQSGEGHLREGGGALKRMSTVLISPQHCYYM